MRKLVLGIIALVSMQFAFVTYMMVLRSPMERTSAPAPTQPGSSNQDPIRTDHLNSVVEEVRKPEVPVFRNESLSTTTRRAETKVDLRSAKRLSKRPAAPAKTAGPIAFENVIIRYNRNPDNLACDTRDTPKSKNKRSFMAKAGHVIKKPWGWMKSVGSKLN